MTDILIKLFVKDCNSPQDPQVREKFGVFSSVVGIILNLLLSAFKILAGVLSYSISILADGLNNLSDAGTSIVSMVSFKIAAKPADREHPFGHARIEYVCSMVVSFLILLVGFEVLSEAISSIFNPTTENAVTTLTYVVLSVSILAKLWLGFFYRRIAKKIDSTVISASSVDSFSDAVSTAVILLATVITKLTGFVYIDSIMGIIVSALIMISGIKILNETKNSLLGEAPMQELTDSIHSIVNEYPEVLGIHDMLIHNYGPQKYFASFHAEVDGAGDVFALHDTIDNIEREISRDLGILCTIHMDPITTNDETVNELKAIATAALKKVCDDASLHDFRTVVGHTHVNLIFDIELPFEEKRDENSIVEEVSKEVAAIREDCYCVITVDRK